MMTASKLMKMLPAKVLMLGTLLCVSAQEDVVEPTNVVEQPTFGIDNINMFYDNGGCLNTLKKGNFTGKLRVCNSNDPPDAEALGYCRQSPFDYTEVRLAGQDWETNYMSVWLLQIILSELLEVPTTVEIGRPGSGLDFYAPNADFLFGGGDFYYNELKTAAEVKDCRVLQEENNEENYRSCFHMVPEVWWADRYGATSIRLEGAESPRELGALGYQSFWIVKPTAKNDSTLVSYLGLQGEENRRKLAETFKRPVTWKQYCDEISMTNCQEPDETAQRPPTEEEEHWFFDDGNYAGYFRFTEKNDCDKWPQNCTGFFADFPCGYASFANQQLYHHNIALESDNPLDEAGGYKGAQMKQLYWAANATGENLIIYWYDLGILHQSFMGTDYEPTRIVFPEVTQECLDARIDPTLRCGKMDGSSTLEELVGDPAGICAATTSSLKKVISTGLYDIAFDPDTPEALWSPAYDVINSFQISSPQLGQILRTVASRLTLRREYGLTLREATCEWAAENLELLQGFIPESHPRVIEDEDVSGNALFTAAMVLAAFAVVLVLVCIVVTFVKKNTKVLYYTQPQFVVLFLVGLGLVGVGAIVMTVPPTDATCITTAWMVNIGYAIHLVPLLLRINAINNLATSGKQMQRVRLKLYTLYAVTFGTAVAVAIYVLVWILVDAPQESFHYEVNGAVNEDGDTIITAFDYCGSSSSSSSSSYGVWYILSYVWRALIILPAGMIAFMSLRVREDLNDTKSMSMVLFIHLITLVISVVIWALGEHRSDMMGVASLVLSADILFSTLVYVLPKFIFSGEELEAEPLPDVFVNTTICLTDVVGFTAWCSCREPVQVFKFLEDMYECIDTLAEKHAIFKVETVGECWVGASGIPEARSDHAVSIARFAMACMKKVHRLTKQMEVKFGPDTGDLTLRIGLHSGAVTGGFMKGKGARFQLFGDCMSTATLIKNLAISDHIHMSEATANELIKAGKKKWVIEREKKLITEEKGEIQTYWLARSTMNGGDFSSVGGGSSVSSDDEEDELMEYSLADSKQRWIQWNVETFKELLKEIVARREGQGAASSEFLQPGLDKKAAMPLEEVAEIIELPTFDKKAAKRQRENIQNVELSPAVVEQLKQYITEIADMYNDNPFHNFAHASYVVMAVTKYMNRIKNAQEIDVGNDEERFRTSTMAAIHKHTYGVTSDPLTLFACVYSALIHDADHPGVPNPQLIKENEEVGEKYKGRSVAEQKSLDLSWELLMESRFNLLRSTIAANDKELNRFRQLVINSVMATDLGDKELKELRNSRWEKAFANNGDSTITSSDDASVSRHSRSDSGDGISFDSVTKGRQEAINRKATIVIEHLIQAADVAHMSQHWAIYRKWNERLFREVYKAYREGRADKNPADNWYKGEIGFFDFYIIPLSKKLRDCGVFGPTSDENLNYATNNRNQWEREGEGITEAMLKMVEREYDENATFLDEKEQSVV